jgi:hypothetical protein
VDWPLLFSLAIAQFWPARPLVGKIGLSARLLLAMCAGCTLGVMWEIIEFTSDLWLGTHIQHSIRETILDLLRDVTGGLTVVGYILLKAARQ